VLTAPEGRVVVVTPGGGETTTGVDADFVGSETETAFSATVMFDVTDAGALKVAAVAVVLVNVPHAFPLQDAPDTDHVTPLLSESLATAAVKFRV
jgi:hypothetical protein